MKIPNFKQMLVEIEKERGIKEEDLLAAIKDAILSAAKKRFKNVENLEAQISSEGEAKIYSLKTVKKKVEDPDLEIELKKAQKIKKKCKVDDVVQIEVTPKDFGRIAAQTAKQVIIQRIREAEKEGAYEEFIHKVGELINGIVQRKEPNGYLINIGRIETFLIVAEQIPKETLKPRDNIKLLVLDVKKTPKGPIIIVSRSHPNFVKKLFELEIPEIKEGILEVKAIAREAGRRTKIAILSNDEKVGVVGTCVGPMGQRIQAITKELKVERIDIIEWSKNPTTFISNALSPAKISKVEINEEEKGAKVFLSEKELSLAIGREGQNVRLASKLTGYKIDIVSEGEKEDVSSKSREKSKGAREEKKKEPTKK